MGQARTWNLMIDVIAQTGKCAPGETDLSRFIIEGTATRAVVEAFAAANACVLFVGSGD